MPVTQAASPASNTVCNGSQWHLVPIKVSVVEDTAPNGTPVKSGFKYVIVDMALENQSPYWGQLESNDPTSFWNSPREVALTTEGGFAYLLEDQFSPHSSNVQTLILQYPLPPGFSTRGNARTAKHSGASNFGQAQMSFKVATTQNHFRLNIAPQPVSCQLGPDAQHRDGKFYDRTDQFSFDLDHDIRTPSYPSSQPDSSFETFTTVKFQQGTLQLLDTHNIPEPTEQPAFEPAGMPTATPTPVSAGWLALHFLFTNSNAGYEAGVTPLSYLIGDDGFVRGADASQFVCPLLIGFSAGPGQTNDGTMCFFLGHTTATHFKFIWYANYPYR